MWDQSPRLTKNIPIGTEPGWVCVEWHGLARGLRLACYTRALARGVFMAHTGLPRAMACHLYFAHIFIVPARWRAATADTEALRVTFWRK